MNLLKLDRDSWRSFLLLGPLVDCSAKDHREALMELFVSVAFATMPFWLGGLVLYAGTANMPTGYWTMVLSTFRQGELFIFATSMLGPIIYMAFADPANARAFPSRLEHAVLVFLLIAICAAMFGLHKGGAQTNLPFLFGLSIACGFAAIGLRYLASVYHKMRTRDPSEEMRDREHAFVDQFAEHRG
jgi:hypothetical protein